MPEVDRIREKYTARGVGFVALALTSNAESVRQTAKRWGIQMPVAFVRPEAMRFNGKIVIPSVLFIDRSATIVAAATGEQPASFFESQIQSLLKP